MNSVLATLLHGVLDVIRFIEANIWWLAIGAAVVYYYAARLRLLKQSIRYRRHFALAEFDPDATELPAEVVAWFADVRDELTPLGFQAVRHFLFPDFRFGLVAVVVVFENHAEGLSTRATAIYNDEAATGLPSMLQATTVDFITKFMDGSEQRTCHNGVVFTYTSLPYRLTQLPIPLDLESVYRVHQYLVEAYEVEPLRRLPPPEEWIDRLRHDYRQYLLVLEQTGGLSPDASGDVLVPTWRGIIRLQWKGLWPIAPIHWGYLRHRARRLVAKARRQQTHLATPPQ